MEPCGEVGRGTHQTLGPLVGPHKLSVGEDDSSHTDADPKSSSGRSLTPQSPRGPSAQAGVQTCDAQQPRDASEERPKLSEFRDNQTNYSAGLLLRGRNRHTLSDHVRTSSE